MSNIPTVRAAAVALVLAASLGLVATCSRDGGRATGGPSLPPVVLISVDTLRADRLPAYGYAEGSTPAIDALVADALLFERAFSHAPTTLPSHASMLTGLLPGDHGARDNAGFTLASAAVTLPERLRERGYRTGAFVSAFPLRAETGLARGFETYDADLEAAAGQGIGEIQRQGSATIDRALAWLREPDERPAFLFVHLFEPHFPYAAPAALAERFVDPYDAEVAQADRLVARLLRELRSSGLYDEALIAFVSDHGEGLGDHGEELHGLFLYTATLHVPLVVKLPRGVRAGERVAAPAQLIDLAPTVLAATGLEPDGALLGRDLAALDASTPLPSIYAETHAPRLNFGWSELTSIIEFPMHYIEAPEPELYDLSTDPGELDNRVYAAAEPARRLAARAATLARPLASPAVVDAAASDRLAALGYVGGGAVSGSRRADPKDKVHVLRHLEAAAALFFAGRYEDAIQEYENAIAEDPGIPAAWEFLGRAQSALGRPDEAADAFEALLALNPTATEARIRLAEIDLARGRPESAAAEARLSLTERPVRARIVMARLAIDRADRAEARRWLGEVVAHDDDHLEAHALLTELLLADGDAPGALPHADRALELGGDGEAAGGLRVLRGRVLMAMGRPSQASESFLAEIARFPTNLQAYRQLALLHLTAGDADLGGRVLEQMVETNRGPTAELWAIQVLRETGAAEVAEQWRVRAHQRYPRVAEFEH